LSVYHSVPIRATSAATTPDSASDDGQLDYITSRPTSLFFTDEPEADRDACVTESNQTVCSIEHAFLNTGLCGRSHLILSESILDGYLVIHSLIYPFCLLVVLVLYSLIYRTVLIRRARKLKTMHDSVLAMARRSTPASPPPVDTSTAGRPTTGRATATVLIEL